MAVPTQQCVLASISCHRRRLMPPRPCGCCIAAATAAAAAAATYICCYCFLLVQYLSTLNKMAETFNCAVFITNQVTADPGAAAMFGEAKKPIGGHVMAHASTVRIQLKKGRGDERIAKIYDSPDVRDCIDILFVLHLGITQTPSLRLLLCPPILLS